MELNVLDARKIYCTVSQHNTSFSDLDGCPLLPNRTEMEIVSEVIQILKPMKDVTDEVNAEKQVTISKLIPLIRCMENMLQSSEPHFDIGKLLKFNILANIRKRFGEIEKVKLIGVATSLDPRFKRLHFQSPANCSAAITFLDRELKALGSSPRSTEDLQSPSNVPSLWSFHNHLVKSKISAEDSSTALSVSLKQYLQLSVVDLKDNPLFFWERNKQNYPELYKLHLKYLCVSPK